jgi:CBS domain-containing protein
MSVGKICTRLVHTAAPEETALDAAIRMKRHGVGTLVVLDDEQKPIGLLTDRDITTRCVAEDLDPRRALVVDLMSTPVTTISEHTPIEAGLTNMAAMNIRRVVVVDERDKLIGLLSLDDVLELLSDEAATISRLIRAQAPV